MKIKFVGCDYVYVVFLICYKTCKFISQQNCWVCSS